jgi:hypothetical protein
MLNLSGLMSNRTSIFMEPSAYVLMTIRYKSRGTGCHLQQPIPLHGTSFSPVTCSEPECVHALV